MVESSVLRRTDAELDANLVRANLLARAETTPVLPDDSTVRLRRTTLLPMARMGVHGSSFPGLSLLGSGRRELMHAQRVQAQRAQTMLARLRTLLGLPAAFVTGGYISRTILRRCLRVFRLAASRALATHLYHNLHQPPRVAGAFLV